MRPKKQNESVSRLRRKLRMRKRRKFDLLTKPAKKFKLKMKKPNFKRMKPEKKSAYKKPKNIKNPSPKLLSKKRRSLNRSLRRNLWQADLAHLRTTMGPTRKNKRL